MLALSNLVGNQFKGHANNLYRDRDLLEKIPCGGFCQIPSHIIIMMSTAYETTTVSNIFWVTIMHCVKRMLGTSISSCIWLFLLQCMSSVPLALLRWLSTKLCARRWSLELSLFQQMSPTRLWLIDIIMWWSLGCTSWTKHRFVDSSAVLELMYSKRTIVV